MDVPAIASYSSKPPHLPDKLVQEQSYTYGAARIRPSWTNVDVDAAIEWRHEYRDATWACSVVLYRRRCSNLESYFPNWNEQKRGEGWCLPMFGFFERLPCPGKFIEVVPILPLQVSHSLTELPFIVLDSILDNRSTSCLWNRKKLTSSFLKPIGSSVSGGGFLNSISASSISAWSFLISVCLFSSSLRRVSNFSYIVSTPSS